MTSGVFVEKLTEKVLKVKSIGFVWFMSDPYSWKIRSHEPRQAWGIGTFCFRRSPIHNSSAPLTELLRRLRGHVKLKIVSKKCSARPAHACCMVFHPLWVTSAADARAFDVYYVYGVFWHLRILWYCKSAKIYAALWASDHCCIRISIRIQCQMLIACRCSVTTCRII